MNRAETYFIGVALLSAMLFGASTPLSKYLLEALPPFQLAGLLYLGAALGVLPFSLRRRSDLNVSHLDRKNLARLAGAIALGGVAGPVLLLYGLRLASSASVAMWLNLELALTAVLGYLLFRDYLGPFGWVGVAGTFLASVLLSWSETGIGAQALVLVGAAGLCWAFDNHLTALVDGITPTQSTFWKGIVAGAINSIIGFSGEPFALEVAIMLTALLVGVFSYGFSISLYIAAAQNLGATRSQMLFSSAPFFGVALSILFLGENLSAVQFAAAVLLTISLVVLFRDKHGHYHRHETLQHKHQHKHDDGHHDHTHDDTGTTDSHSHWHTHEPKSHSHPHWPDLHHRHRHGHMR